MKHRYNVFIWQNGKRRYVGYEPHLCLVNTNPAGFDNRSKADAFARKVSKKWDVEAGVEKIPVYG